MRAKHLAPLVVVGNRRGSLRRPLAQHLDRDVAGRGVTQQLCEADRHDQERDAEDPERTGDLLGAQQPRGQRRDVDARQTEARDHEAGDEALAARREPLDRRGRGRGVAQADPDAGEQTEAEHDGEPVRRRGVARDDHPDAAHRAADGGHDPRTEAVLRTPREHHGHCEHSARDRVGHARLTRAPSPAALGYGLGQRLGDDAPRVEHAEREVDAQTCKRDDPPARGSRTCHARTSVYSVSHPYGAEVVTAPKQSARRT